MQIKFTRCLIPILKVTYLDVRESLVKEYHVNGEYGQSPYPRDNYVAKCPTVYPVEGRDETQVINSILKFYKDKSSIDYMVTDVELLSKYYTDSIEFGE